MEALPMSKTLQNALSSLPGPDATLEELIKFCQENDPSHEFMERWERWGPEFHDRARELWGASTHAFKEGRATDYTPDEILMCMSYDVTVAPYIGVPKEISHAYLHAMLRELRDKV